ncbi:hypothetical protein Q7P37_000203 [Cladosporium fusiforme]
MPTTTMLTHRRRNAVSLDPEDEICEKLTPRPTSSSSSSSSSSIASTSSLQLSDNRANPSPSKICRTIEAAPSRQPDQNLASSHEKGLKGADSDSDSGIDTETDTDTYIRIGTRACESDLPTDDSEKVDIPTQCLVIARITRSTSTSTSKTTNSKPKLAFLSVPTWHLNNLRIGSPATGDIIREDEFFDLNTSLNPDPYFFARNLLSPGRIRAFLLETFGGVERGALRTCPEVVREEAAERERDEASWGRLAVDEGVAMGSLDAGGEEQEVCGFEGRDVEERWPCPWALPVTPVRSRVTFPGGLAGFSSARVVKRVEDGQSEKKNFTTIPTTIPVLATFTNSLQTRTNLRLPTHLQVDFDVDESLAQVKEFFHQGGGSWRGLARAKNLVGGGWKTEIWVLPCLRGCEKMFRWEDVEGLRAGEFCDARMMEEEGDGRAKLFVELRAFTEVSQCEPSEACVWRWRLKSQQAAISRSSPAQTNDKLQPAASRRRLKRRTFNTSPRRQLDTAYSRGRRLHNKPALHLSTADLQVRCRKAWPSADTGRGDSASKGRSAAFSIQIRDNVFLENTDADILTTQQEPPPPRAAPPPRRATSSPPPARAEAFSERSTRTSLPMIQVRPVEQDHTMLHPDRLALIQGEAVAVVAHAAPRIYEHQQASSFEHHQASSPANSIPMPTMRPRWEYALGYNGSGGGLPARAAAHEVGSEWKAEGWPIGRGRAVPVCSFDMDDYDDRPPLPIHYHANPRYPPSNTSPPARMGAQKRMSNGEVKAPVGPHPSTIRVSAQYQTQAAIERKLQPPTLDLHERSIAEAKEDSLRLQGVQWLDIVRRALQLPVRTFTTACTYFHKFRLAHPPGTPTGDSYIWSDAAAASLLTACKMEDTLKKSREILAASYNLKAASAHDHLPSDDPMFEQQSRVVIGLERMVLEASTFDFRSRAPHHTLTKIAKTMRDEDGIKQVHDLAWTALTDIYRTTAPLKQTSVTLALSMVELAARLTNADHVLAAIERYDLEKINTTREETMETILDSLDLYVQHTTASTLGTRFSLDDFLRLRLALNKESEEHTIPRHCTAPTHTSPTTRVQNGHPTPVSPPQNDNNTNVPPQAPIILEHAPPVAGGTLRFMLNPHLAHDERTQVESYFKEEWEEYEEEIEVPIPRTERRHPPSESRTSSRDDRDRASDFRRVDDRDRERDRPPPPRSFDDRRERERARVDREREFERDSRRPPHHGHGHSHRDARRYEDDGGRPPRRYDERRYDERRFDDRRGGPPPGRDERRFPRDQRR